MQANAFKRLRISGWRQFDAVDMELHPRLTIITGANGAGKSTLLGFFTRHFGYQRHLLATPESRSGTTSFRYGLFRALRRAFSRESIPTTHEHSLQIGELEYTNGHSSPLQLPPGRQLNYLVSIISQQGVPGIHVDSHRPPNIYRNVAHLPAAPPEANGLGNALNAEFMHYYTNGQVQSGSLHHMKMALIQMSIFGHGNKTMDPKPELVSLFSGFEDKLRILLPESLGFNRIIIRSPEILLSTRSGDFLLDAASGGVIKLFEIAWQLYFFEQLHREFVITFDEPENHLHPSMQKSLLPNILKAFPNTQVIAATHSPFIISAIQDSFVYVLRYVNSELVEREYSDDDSSRGLFGSRVIAERLDTINKAGTASEILRDVLGITTTIPDWAEDRVRQILEEFRGRDVTDRYLRDLYGRLEREGLASSYPSAISSLTSEQ